MGEQWLPLVARNDWGRETVHAGYDGPPIGAGNLAVLWEDGTTETVGVEMEPYSGTISDMGAPYPFSGQRPIAVVLHHGAPLRVPLKTLGCKVKRQGTASMSHAPPT